MQPQYEPGPAERALAAVVVRAREKEQLDAPDWPALVRLVPTLDRVWPLYRLLSWLDLDGPGGAEQRLLAELAAARIEQLSPSEPPLKLPEPPVLDPVGAVSLPEFGRDFGSWAEFTEFLGTVTDRERLEKVAAQVQLSVARYAVEARLREVKNGHASRMLRGHAKLGVELQDLDSVVAELPDLGPVDPLAGLVRPLATAGCGDGKGWRLTGDGSDFEGITAETGNPFALGAAVAEMRHVYDTMRAAGPGLYCAGGTRLLVTDGHTKVGRPPKNRVWPPDRVRPGGAWLSGSAQPQYNVDIPLDVVVDYVRDLHTTARYENLFGIDEWFWRKAQTKRETTAYQDAARALAKQDIKPLLGPAAIGDRERTRQAQGYLLLVAMCAIHAVSFPTEVAKDMPLLPKTNLGRLEQALGEARILAGQPPADGERRSRTAMIVQFLQDRNVITTKSAGLAAVIDRVAGGRHPFLDADLAPQAPVGIPGRRWKGKHPRYQIVFEYRRVPVQAAERWEAEAMLAFEQFVVDAPGTFD